ncbi:hypothetical protein [Parasphingorhabdus halotolerans]|uniref:Uncharacterized protein n=1 Tax=Parasphingorhabdus halotolerans TaxID=2725558 RepID=A0A6H2DKR7_9SPHN|nr:hypothetical protein [Parasphingorhabdus halotolerans]QJB68944.1 hypothetical protein HF685_06355 [Parasphingorhabdus halotolerans]
MAKNTLIWKISDSIQGVIDELILDYRLMKSLNALKRNNTFRSRVYLNKVLAVYDNSCDFYIFVVAFDAMVMNAENRHDESLERLRECKSLLEGKYDADSQYARLFCKFYECLYVGGKHCKKYQEESQSLDANSTIRRFLKFPKTWPKADTNG